MKCNRTLHDEFRHAVASTSEYCRVRQYSSVPAPSLRPRLATTHSVLICHDFLFLFSVWWWRARSGFSKGETDGILSANSVDSVLPNYFLGIWIWQNRDQFFRGNSDLVSRAEEGSGEESARASEFHFGEPTLKKKIQDIEVLAKPRHKFISAYL